ncbi:MAG: hypothetical protein V4559_07205 [Pseudomonadota bacterium]
MTRTALVTAGILLSMALATTCQAAVDCKTSPGSPGCPSPKAVKTIAPPKPDQAAKPASKPTPRPEPRVIPAGSAPKTAPPKPAKQAAGEPLQPPLSARRTARRHSLAQNPRSYRYDSQPEARLSSPRAPTGRPGSPVYEADRGPPTRSGYGCDEVCRYRIWFRQYNDWYQAYGRRYAPYPHNPDAASTHGEKLPQYAYRGGQSERDRLDPWHGYNPDDGPQNGY